MATPTPKAVAAIVEQVRVRVRVLRWFTRSGLIDSDHPPHDTRL